MLTNFDILGIEYNFKFKESTEFKTLFGAAISIIYYIVALIAWFFFIVKFFDTENPELQRKEIRNFTFPEIKVPQEQFYAYMRLRDNKRYIPIDQIPKYVNIFYLYETFSVNLDPSATKDQIIRISENVEAIPCKETIWYKENGKKIFSKEEQTKIELYSLCYDDSKANVTLYGGTNNPPYTLLSAQVYNCLLGTSCLTFEQMKNTELLMGFYESNFDVADYKNPLKLNSNQIWKFNFLEGIRQEWRVLISKIEVYTDEGWFFESLRKDTGYALDIGDKDSRLDYPGFKQGQLIAADLYSSNKYIEYKRSYFYLMDVFSGIGGVLELVVFIFMIFYAPLNSMWLNRKLVRLGIMNKRNSRRNLSITNFCKRKNKKMFKFENKHSGDLEEFKFLEMLDEFSFENVNRIQLVNAGILETRNDNEKMKSYFYKNCENQLEALTDVYTLMQELNQLIIFKNTYFSLEQHKLAPFIAVSLYQLQKNQKNHIGSSLEFGITEPRKELGILQALKMLEVSSKEESADDMELGLNHYINQRVKELEKREELLRVMIKIVRQSGFVVSEGKELRRSSNPKTKLKRSRLLNESERSQAKKEKFQNSLEDKF